MYWQSLDIKGFQALTNRAKARTTATIIKHNTEIFKVTKSQNTCHVVTLPYSCGFAGLQHGSFSSFTM